MTLNNSDDVQKIKHLAVRTKATGSEAKIISDMASEIDEVAQKYGYELELMYNGKCADAYHILIMKHN